MSQCYSVVLDVKIKDRSLLIKLTNEFIKSTTFQEGCWDGADLKTEEGCIEAILCDTSRYLRMHVTYNGNGFVRYANAFNASYSWGSVLDGWFRAIAPALDERSSIDVDTDDGGYRVRIGSDGKVYPNRISLNDVSAVCDDCARAAGCKPKNKICGVWVGTCDICKKSKTCTNLWHDWIVPKRKEKDNG